MLRNAERHAEGKGVDVGSLVTEHIQANKACKMWRRTHRAHSRIRPHRSSPCHSEMTLPEKEQTVPEPEGKVAQKERISQKTLKKQNLRSRE